MQDQQREGVLSINKKGYGHLKGTSRSSLEMQHLGEHKEKDNEVNEIEEIEEINENSEVKRNPEKEKKYFYRGDLFDLVEDPYEALEDIDECVVEQKLILFEVLTGIEENNKYNVYAIDSNYNKTFLFKFKEHNTFWCRNCMPGNDRPFVLTCEHIRNSNKDLEDYKETIAEFNRPYQFTCGYVCGPSMYCYFNEEPEHKNKKLEMDENGINNRNSQLKDSKKFKNESSVDVMENHEETGNYNFDNKKSMGVIAERFSCGAHVDILDGDGKLIYKIIGNFFQMGYMLRITALAKCYEIDFWIYGPDDDTSNTIPLGNIHWIFKGLTELTLDSDAYIVHFPKKATAIEKLLILAATVFIDFRFFERVAYMDCGNIV